MSRIARSALCVLAFSSVACFHAIITTGRPESSKVIDKPWASSFLWGLVPPDVVAAGEECKGGVAKVETQHSFLNGLVYWLTIGIYSPITITVTCAGNGSASIQVPADATPAERTAAFKAATDQAVHTGQPVLIGF